MDYLRKALKDYSDKRRMMIVETPELVPLKRDNHLPDNEMAGELCKQYIERLCRRSFCRGIFDGSCLGVNATASKECSCSHTDDACCNSPTTTSPDELTTADLLRVLLDPQVLDMLSRRLEHNIVGSAVD